MTNSSAGESAPSLVASEWRRGVYLITRETPDTAHLLSIVEAALRAGVVMVQYRDKSNEPDRRIGQASMLSALCDQYKVPLIINDDSELARIVGAQGVHLGEHDGALAASRDKLGANAIIGVSCYNDGQRAREAHAAGANYIAFGAFFESPTKPEARRAAIDLIPAAKSLGLPIVGIGGITRDNAHHLINAGIDSIAVISEIFDAPDAHAAARDLVLCFQP